MNYENLVRVLREEADSAGFRMDRNAWYTVVKIVELHAANKGTPGEPIICDYCKIIYPCPEVAIVLRELT